MNWNLVVGPVCGLFGILITLYVKDKARDVAKQEFTDQIKGALSVFKMELIDSLDRTYRRSGECTLMMEHRDDRIDINDERLNTIDSRFDGLKSRLRGNND